MVIAQIFIKSHAKITKESIHSLITRPSTFHERCAHRVRCVAVYTIQKLCVYCFVVANPFFTLINYKSYVIGIQKSRYDERIDGQQGTPTSYRASENEMTFIFLQFTKRERSQ